MRRTAWSDYRPPRRRTLGIHKIHTQGVHRGVHRSTGPQGRMREQGRRDAPTSKAAQIAHRHGAHHRTTGTPPHAAEREGQDAAIQADCATTASWCLRAGRRAQGQGLREDEESRKEASRRGCILPGSARRDGETFKEGHRATSTALEHDMYMRLINCWCERSGFGTYVVPRAGKTIGKGIRIEFLLPEVVQL